MPFNRFEVGDRVIVDEEYPLNIVEGSAPSEMVEYFGMEGTIVSKKRQDWSTVYDDTLVYVEFDNGKEVGWLFSIRFKLISEKLPVWEV